jgi:hypothetical protein
VRGHLAEGKLKREGFFEPSYVQKLLREHSKWVRDHRKLLWTLLVFELWQETYLRRSSPRLAHQARYRRLLFWDRGGIAPGCAEIAAPVNEPHDRDPAFFDAIDEAITTYDDLAEIGNFQLSNGGAPLGGLSQARSGRFDFLQEITSCTWRLLGDVLQSFE